MFALRNPSPTGNSTPSARLPVEILQERFARGEIAEEEYHRRMRVLRE
ncbi:MAG: SHOCT domain-containing protein [Candidatus Iainarchaeum archaeon]|uniref:SHOCT domain-containing protein n=1 Tax=Candidatus Iainarchaeum sp. TaxID=3101447 RepID=A0A7T9I2L4_9ARCH|nr:MAG: SHOCT domain-containing protein [Candidatus Diapherotrites archaeon]